MQENRLPRSRAIIRLTGSCLLAAMLASCGGGGGDPVVPVPEFIFEDVAGGCRADLKTGLTWGTLDGMAYQQAGVAALVVAANAGAGLCGFTDWRVPGVEEMGSLVDTARAANPINADAGGAVASPMAGPYWSVDARVAAATDQMVMDFSALGAVGPRLKTLTAAARLVRGTPLGDPCLAGQFTVNMNGTVTDARTKLVWKQCSEGLSDATCTTGVALDTTTTVPADRLALVNANPPTLGSGFSDWRIPTRKELASLVCRSAGAAPLIDLATFPATDAVSFISSTLHPTSGLPWFVNFDAEGSIGVGAVAGKRIRLVRAGP